MPQDTFLKKIVQSGIKSHGISIRFRCLNTVYNGGKKTRPHKYLYHVINTLSMVIGTGLRGRGVCLILFFVYLTRQIIWSDHFINRYRFLLFYSNLYSLIEDKIGIEPSTRPYIWKSLNNQLHGAFILFTTSIDVNV